MPKKKQIFVEKSQVDQQLVKALDKAGIPYELSPDEAIDSHYRSGKKDIHLVPKKGDSMDTCATISDKYICCNVKVLKSVSNCPYDCSYCFLQNYLNDGRTKVVSDTDSLMKEVKEKCEAEPNRLFRIGTWELGDSLALEEDVAQASLLIEAFKDIPNAILELKTKSNKVDPILNCDHGGHTVVSWSLNSEKIVTEQEHKTARLHERLDALKKVTDAGYLVGLHFDPIILHEGWQQQYASLIKQSIAATNSSQIAWISIGSLRFNPEMKKKIEINFPKTSITHEEMVQGDDGKVRYVKPIRNQLYQHFVNELKTQLNCDDLSTLTGFTQNKPLVYFCMERWDMWEKFLIGVPKSIQHLDYLFAQSMHQRYPAQFPQTPDIKHYA